MATESAAVPLAPAVSGRPADGRVEDKGLKKNAIGFLSNVVIGTASVAPAYSLAATLGFIAADKGVGVHAPAVLLASFVPIRLADAWVAQDAAWQRPVNECSDKARNGRIDRSGPSPQ